MIDIDGGIGTLFAYASRGRRELPSERFLIDGDVESLSKGGSFIGLHIRTPLTGVAVHINAFNFPCWGMLEKLAPALLAGMPVITKPATATAYVAEASRASSSHPASCPRAPSSSSPGRPATCSTT